MPSSTRLRPNIVRKPSEHPDRVAARMWALAALLKATSALLGVVMSSC